MPSGHSMGMLAVMEPYWETPEVIGIMPTAQPLLTETL